MAVDLTSKIVQSSSVDCGIASSSSDYILSCSFCSASGQKIAQQVTVRIERRRTILYCHAVDKGAKRMLYRKVDTVSPIGLRSRLRITTKKVT